LLSKGIDFTCFYVILIHAQSRFIYNVLNLSFFLMFSHLLKMDPNKPEIETSPPKMKSFLLVHEGEKLLIRRLETELMEVKKLVDQLVKQLKDQGKT
jgi:hypothetical protein